MMRILLSFLLLPSAVRAFAPRASSRSRRATNRGSQVVVVLQSTSSVLSMMEPKEAVKLFGRLAEKYIMLDATGGMCCYSACSDCEFREPGGGYRMADQSSSRPKWIPVYESREFETLGKQHTSKWSSEIFTDGPAVAREEFVAALVERLNYVPPLGGPYLSASAATLEDESTAGALFDLLAGDKEKLTKHRMSLRLRELSDGEEGLTWAAFERAMGATS